MLASDQKYSLKWLSSSKGNYIFFRHDIASSHVDPSVKFIMEASITENDVDRHVSNLKVNYSCCQIINGWEPSKIVSYEHINYQDIWLLSF